MMNRKHHQQLKQPRQPKQRTYEEVLQQFRKDFPPSNLKRITDYTKKLGEMLIEGLKSLFIMFQTKLSSNIAQKQVKQIVEESQPNLNQNKKRRIVRVNFNEFHCDDQMLQNYQEHQKVIVQEKKPVRSYIFKPEEQQEILEDDKPEDDAFQFFIDQYGHKLMRLKPIIKKDSISIVEVIANEPPYVRARMREVYSNFMMSRVDIMYEQKERSQKRKKELKQKGLQMDDMYKNYLRSLGLKPQENPSHKRLANLIRQRRARVQQPIPRKLTHTEIDPPPIYCVDKVLQVLEKQRQQFMNKRREEHEKMKQDARKIEDQIRQKERKIEQERRELQKRKELEQLNKRRQQQAQIQNLRKQNEQKEASVEKEQNQLPVIQEKQQPNEIHQSEQQEIQFTLNRQNKSHYGVLIKQAQQIEKPSEQHLYQSPKQLKKLGQEPIVPFSTPKKNQNVPNQQAAPILTPQLQPRQSDKKQNNPFIRNSPVKVQTLQDLMSKDQKPSLFQFQPANPTPSAHSAIFSQNNPVVNLFSNQPAQSNNSMTAMVEPQPQDPSNNFQSPTNIMNIPIGGGFMGRQSLQSSMFPMVSPNSMANNPNSSIHSSNLPTYNNNDMSPGFGQGQILGTHSGPAAMGDGRGMLSAFVPNPNAARLFQNNLFRATPPQPLSLFGASSVPQQNKDYSSQRGRKKGQIRIS